MCNLRKERHKDNFNYDDSDEEDEDDEGMEYYWITSDKFQRSYHDKCMVSSVGDILN